jgi:aerobic carbon-monoxide dehydrogenase large subunit
MAPRRWSPISPICRSSSTLRPAARPCTPRRPDNIAYRFDLGDAGAVGGAGRFCPSRAARVEDSRIIAASMEPRGAFAEWQDGSVASVRQRPGGLEPEGAAWPRNWACRRCGPRDQPRCRRRFRDEGDGLSRIRRAGPCRADAVASGPLDATAANPCCRTMPGAIWWRLPNWALMPSHKITAYRVNPVSNLGAYNSQFGQPIQSELFSKVLTGVYDIQTAHLARKGCIPTPPRSMPIAAPAGPRRS